MILKSLNEFNKHLPKQGKFMALDLGTKRIGIATCDETHTICTPKKILIRQSNQKDFEQIHSIITEYNIKAIIVGFPVNIDATLNEMSFFTKKFIEELNKFLGNNFLICLSDERLTTFEARQIGASIKGRKHQKPIDDIAACVILEDFLNILNQLQEV